MTQSLASSHGRMQSLDTMRGVAVLMVITLHVSWHFRPVRWLFEVARLGNQGVQLFFLISAITMCFMWKQRADEPQRQLKFYIRRFFRIAPLFWIAVCLYSPSWWLNGGHGTMEAGDWADVALTVTFLHGFSPSAINKLVTGGWSIAVEMSFYVVFPWLAARLTSAVRAFAFAFVSYLVLGVIVTSLIERFVPLDPRFLYACMLTQFPIFAIGMALYYVTMQPGPFAWRSMGAIAAAWLAFAVVGKYAFGLEARPVFWLQVALLAAFVYLMIRRSWHLRVLSFIGNLSYSMYLFHFAVIDLLVRLIPSERRDGTAMYLCMFLLVVVVTSGVAKLSSLTFEAWSSAISRAIIARLRPRLAPGLSAV